MQSTKNRCASQGAMKKIIRSNQVFHSLLLASTSTILTIFPVKSQEILSIGVNQGAATNNTFINASQHKVIQSARMLVQSTKSQNIPSNEVVQVTGVKANPTNKGLELILQTSKGDMLQPINRSAVNNFIADIPSAQLRLPSGEAFTFHSDKPIAGVSEITVTNLDAKTIRVTVKGETKLPTIDLFDSPEEGLIFSVLSTAPSTPQTPQTQTPQTQTPQTPQTPQTQTPQTQTPKPSAQGDEPIELVVTGEQNGYNVPDASTATKTDTPLRDIPASIQVVPQQVLQDQGAVRLQDALQNVSGITQALNYLGSGSGGYIIRGFEQDGNFRNGFRDNDQYTLPEIANVEQIEVLKGPASVLFGQAEPGGIINIVTKQPLSEPYYAADFSIGSYDFYRPTIDFSGPLNLDKTLLYRLNVAYQNSGSFRDYVNTDRIFIAPSLSWKIDPKTKLTFDFEYLNNGTTDDRGIVALGNAPAPIPISRFLGVPGTNLEQVVYRASYRLEHQFSDNWQIRNAFSLTSSKTDVLDVYGTSLTNDELSRFAFNDRLTTDNYSLQTEVIGKFATGSISHQTLFGIELNRTAGPVSYGLVSLPSINIFNPVYNATIPSNIPTISDVQTRTDTLGIYFQDQITLLNNLKLIGGGRFDSTNQRNNDLIAEVSTSQYDQAFSPRIGIVYQPIHPISLYASYTSSFLPQTVGTLAANGSTFKPEQGTQYEVGVKGDLSKSISATLAAYQITKANVVDPDPNNPAFYIQVGEQRSRGVELDVTGKILPGWNIIASYAYTNAIITKDTEYPVGNLLNNVAKNTASLWTTYEIQKGNLQGLGFGLGLYYVGDREGDLTNDFVLPSYFRTDAALYYKLNKWKFALNIKNLFDVRYYEAAQTNTVIYPGAPLTLLGTVSVRF